MLGDLVQTTTGQWITHPPTRCPNGHPSVGPPSLLPPISGYRVIRDHARAGYRVANEFSGTLRYLLRYMPRRGQKRRLPNSGNRL